MNFNAIDLNLIRVFDALMHERSVTRAGERIGLSQPAVSAALNRLRHIFNDNLFIRQGNEMLPTPLATQLGERASAALAEIEGMVRNVRGLELHALERTFTLSGADFFSMLLMPLLSKMVQDQAPLVRMRLLDSARGDVTRLLSENTVDLALERQMDLPDFVSRIELFRSPFVIAASASNPAVVDLEEWTVLPIETFVALPHVLRSIDGTLSGLVDEALHEIGRRRQVVLALPHFQAVALTVSTGNHIAALPVQFASVVRASMELKLFRPPFPVPAPTMVMYWHARYDNDQSHKWLREQVLSASKTLKFADFQNMLPTDVRDHLE